MRILLISLLLISLAFTGCKEEEPHFNDTLTISTGEVAFNGNTLTFEAERQTITIDVTTESNDGKWNAFCPSDDVWCSFSLRGGQMILTVALNNTNAIRSTWIEFSLGDNRQRIDVVQNYQRVLTFPGGNSTVVGASRHNETISLTTNIASTNLSASVTLPADCDWISDLVISTTALTFEISRNPSYTDTRSATISVTGDGKTTLLVVTQNALSGYPYVIDISGATFANCYIYEIWDDEHNLKIGELCKEYLHKHPDGASTATVRLQTVVAYPVANGSVDLTNGLAIENGNFVSWNPNITAATPPYDMLASYSAGESVSSTPAVIYFDQGASRMSTFDIDALPQERIYATLKPYIVRDQRSGPANNQGQTTEDFSYPVTKIGTQYWMTENLRTTRFRDGENIPTNIDNATWAFAEGNTITPMCGVRSESGSSYPDANAAGSALTARMAIGVLYNFCAIVQQDALPNTPMSNLHDMISPQGWTAPTAAQFAILRNYTSQTTLATVFVPELDFAGTGDYANATGFGMRGSQQRGATGGYNSGSTYFGSIDYTFTLTPPTGYPQMQHGFYCFRMTAGEVNVAPTGTNTRGNNLYTAAAGHHLRLIRE